MMRVTNIAHKDDIINIGQEAEGGGSNAKGNQLLSAFLYSLVHDKAEKEAQKQEKEAAKAEKEAAKAERDAARAAKKEQAEKIREEQKALEEHKEHCTVCRKTVSLAKHSCKKEDLAELPKAPPEPPELRRAPAYVPGDSDEEPLSYREILAARQYERQRNAALAQVRPMQAWYGPGRFR